MRYVNSNGALRILQMKYVAKEAMSITSLNATILTSNYWQEFQRYYNTITFKIWPQIQNWQIYQKT